MNFLSVLYARAGITVDGVTTLNNTATGQTPATNDNSTKLATTGYVKNQNYYPYPTGTTSQYVRGDGSLATFTQTGGGGSSVSYYLNGSVSQGTIGGNTYYEMSKTAIIGTNADFSINADGYVAQFVTDAGDPALLNIPGGNWNFEMFFSASSNGGSPSFYVELYKYDGTTLTLIASSSANPEYITGGTSTDLYVTALAVPTTTLTLTDRLAIRVYVTHSGRTITLHTQDSHLCQVITSFTTGLTALNGLTAQVQNFAVGAGGSDFNISSVVDTHTFNLPTASATKRGALSSIDWSAFDAKVDFGDLSATAPLNYNGSGVFTIAQSSGSTNGYLSSTDWTTFNAKIGGSGTANYVAKFTSGSVVGNSIIYDNGTSISIGTVSNYGAEKLTVLTTSNASISTVPAIARFMNNGAGNITKIIFTDNTYADGTISFIPSGGSNSTLSFGIQGATVNYQILNIKESGNVGIGTTSPNTKLEVANGLIRVTGNDTDQYFFEGVRTGISTTLRIYDNSSVPFYDSYSSMIFRANQNGGSGGFIGLFGGNVGIGTASPSEKLHIYSSASSTEIRIENSTTSAYIRSQTDNLNFYFNGAEKMRILSGGNVLIGTTTDSGYKFYVNGTGLFNGVVNSYATMDNLARRINSPEGASYVTSASSITGAIKIKLPVARNNSSTMMMFTVKIYQYSTGNSHEFRIGGYNYGGGNWYNPFVTNLTDNGGNFNVYFGYDATSDCVWIGETTSSWVYPQVFVTDFQAGYGGLGIEWATGWGISFETSYDTIELSRTASQVITSRNIGSQSVLYATTAGALTSMNISQFTNNSGYITSASLAGYLPLTGGNLTGLVQSTAAIEASVFRTDNNFELTSALTGLKSNFYDTRFYASSTAYWNITSAAGSSNGALLFRNGFAGTTNGYIYWDSSGFGLLNNTGGWSVRANYGGSMGGTLFGAWSSSGSFTASALIKSGGTSSQFLKADGSIDTNAYITSAALSGYLPLTGGNISGALSVGGGLTTSLINLSDVTTLQDDAELQAVGSLNNGNYGIVARTLYQQSANYLFEPYVFDGGLDNTNVINPAYAVNPSPYDTYPQFAINSFKPGRAYRIKVQSTVSTTNPIVDPTFYVLDLNCKIYLIASDAIFPILTSDHHWVADDGYPFPYQEDGKGYLSMEAIIHCTGVIEEEPPFSDVFSGQGQFSYSKSSTGDAYQSNRIVPMYISTDVAPYTGKVAYIPRNDTDNYHFVVELSGSLLHFEIFSVTIEEL